MVIAQISDTHILARSSDPALGRRRADNLRRCIAHINRQRPDLVVHTGDVTQAGRPEEYARVREILAPDKPTVLLIHHPPFDVADHYAGGYRRPGEAPMSHLHVMSGELVSHTRIVADRPASCRRTRIESRKLT